MNTVKKRTHTHLVCIYMMISLFALPFCAHAQVPTSTTWQVVQENAGQTAKNLWGALNNVASYIPGACKQITYETKLLSSALKECPLTTVLLLSATTYGAWKTYSWLKGNDKITALVKKGQNAGNKVYQYAYAPRGT